MSHRSITWFICIFVVVVVAIGYSYTDSITGSDAEITANSLRTDYPGTEPSTTEPVQKIVGSTTVDLGALLDAGGTAVVTLVAGDTHLVAHRAVLAARSPVFATMMLPDKPEASSNQVTIPDVEGPVLRQLLAYIYSLQAPQLKSMAPQLLVAADKYGLPTLKAECEQEVAAQLSVETAVATAVLAVGRSCANSCEGLRQAAITFIKAHIFHVMGTQGWAHAALTQPNDLMKVVRLLSNPPADICAPSPATADSIGPIPATQPDSGHERTPATDLQTTAKRCDAAVSLLQGVSGEEKGRMLVKEAKEGAVSKLQMLLEVGADVEARDEDKRTALHMAAIHGHLEVARRLIESGAEVDDRDFWQNTPLHLAAWQGHSSVVQLLADSSANLSALDESGGTPLHDAARQGHADAVTVLLEAGADKWIRNNGGDTPLDLAKKNNHQQLIDMIS